MTEDTQAYRKRWEARIDEWKAEMDSWKRSREQRRDSWHEKSPPPGSGKGAATFRSTRGGA